MLEQTKQLLEEGIDCIDSERVCGPEESDELQRTYKNCKDEISEIENALKDALIVFVDTQWFEKYKHLKI